MAQRRGVRLAGHDNEISRSADRWIDEEDKPLSVVDLLADAMRANPTVPVMREVGLICKFEGRAVDAAMVDEAVQRAKAKFPGDVIAAEADLRKNGWHEPMIYYMRLGNRVKIGWTQKIHTRLGAIMPEELMALERGGVTEERARHRCFARLRVVGEWFRVEDPLESFIHTVARDFEHDFGVTMDAWLDGDRPRGDRLGQSPRSRI